MPRPSQSTSGNRKKPLSARKPVRLLLVDPDRRTARQIGQIAGDLRLEVVHAQNLAEARDHLLQAPVHLAMIESLLPDGSGLALAKLIRSDRKAATQTIMLTQQPTADLVIESIRGGAGDVLTKPLDRQEVTARLRQAMARWKSDFRLRRRVQLLRQSCKKLNKAREDISSQVDVLCNDLVTAYQELATQLQQAVQSTEYNGLIREELDIEALLHRTLEYLLEKAGPTNAAILLPATADEYTLSGYVNYDCTDEAADILWQYLSDVVAPKVALRCSPIHLTNDDALSQWIGSDFAYLAERHVLAFPCQHEDEVLAVVVLFRDATQPYHDTVTEVCTSIAPVMGQHLAKVVKIHHRHLPSVEDSNDYYV